MTTFRMRIGLYARAFAMPYGLRQKVALFLRGYRPHEPYKWWSKPNRHQRRISGG